MFAPSGLRPDYGSVSDIADNLERLNHLPSGFPRTFPLKSPIFFVAFATNHCANSHNPNDTNINHMIINI